MSSGFPYVVDAQNMIVRRCFLFRAAKFWSSSSRGLIVDYRFAVQLKEVRDLFGCNLPLTIVVTRGVWRQKIKRGVLLAFAEIAAIARGIRNESGGVNGLDDLHIINGQIDIRMSGGMNLVMKNATLSVESRSLLESNKLSGIRRSVNYLDFKKGILKIDDVTVQLDDINYTGIDSRLIAGTATISNQSKSLDAVARNVMMNQIVINEMTGDVSIGGVNWEKADIKLDAATPTSKKGGSFISLTDINGKNTNFKATLSGKTISAAIDNIHAVAILIKPGEKPIIGGLIVNGHDFSFTQPQSSLTLNEFNIADQAKTILSGLKFNSTSGTDSTIVSIPSLSFVPHLQSAISGEINAQDIRITKPVIKIHGTSKTEKVTAPLHLPIGYFNQLVLEQPEISIIKTTPAGTVSLVWNGQKKSTNIISLSGVKTTANSLEVKGMTLGLNNFVYSTANGRTFDAGDGEITAQLRDIYFQQSAEMENEWQARLNSLEGRNFVLDSIGKKAGRLSINNIGIKDLTLKSSSLGNIRTLIRENANLRLQNVTGEYGNSDNNFKWYNAGYDKTARMASMDSFSYKPTPPHEEFMASREFQTDYLQIKTGAINIGPFDIDSYLKDTIFRIGRIKIDDVDFNDFRDNRPPFRAGIVKPLIVDRIKGIPIKISIDTLVFDNADITYAELNPKTNQTGIILFNRTTIRAFPFRNFDFSPTDSLRIHANGYLMDSIAVRLRLKESYTDSLAGFLFTLRLRPTDLRVLNPVLPPLASARLQSGYLDTISMRVAGGEYLAYGEINMYYHDLKIEILKNGTTERRGFLSFLANSLIKNKNTNKTNSVFFIRNRERSSINYLIKILMSGVNSTIGAKNNKKIIRKYKKELRERNLPPDVYD